MQINQPSNPLIRIAGGIAIVNGIVSLIGVVALIAMFVLFATERQELAMVFGMFNDICVALQYLLTIPIALAVYQILQAGNPKLIRVTTIVGIVSMVLVIGLQLLLIFEVLTFEQQGVWVSIAMILGVGFWLAVTGLAARSTGKLPNSLLMSILAVPYVGYPIWSFWLGQHLLGW